MPLLGDSQEGPACWCPLCSFSSRGAFKAPPPVLSIVCREKEGHPGEKIALTEPLTSSLQSEATEWMPILIGTEGRRCPGARNPIAAERERERELLSVGFSPRGLRFLISLANCGASWRDPRCPSRVAHLGRCGSSCWAALEHSPCPKIVSIQTSLPRPPGTWVPAALKGS